MYNVDLSLDSIQLIRQNQGNPNNNKVKINGFLLVQMRADVTWGAGGGY